MTKILETKHQLRQAISVRLRAIGTVVPGTPLNPSVKPVFVAKGSVSPPEDCKDHNRCCRRRKSVEIWRHKTAAEFGVDRLTHKGPGGPLVIYGRWGQKGGSFSGGSLRVMRSSRYRSSKAIS